MYHTSFHLEHRVGALDKNYFQCIFDVNKLNSLVNNENNSSRKSI